MIIARALTQAMLALQIESDKLLLEYHPTSRRILTISNILLYWIKFIWVYKYNIKCSVFDMNNCDTYKIFYDTTEFIISGIEEHINGKAIEKSEKEIVLSSEHIRVFKQILATLKNCRDIVYHIYGDNNLGSDFICCNCGHVYTEHPSECAICGGNGNQIVSLYDI